MKKKILSILLAIVMVVTITPVSVFAEDDILDYLTYEINDGEVTITGCDQTISGDVVIPDKIEGYTVTTIGELAFWDCKSLESVTISDSVTTIGAYAFCDCTNLTSVTIPDSVTKIGNHAFAGCVDLESITIPDSVITIGCYAFAYCDNLKYVNIGSGVKLAYHSDYGILTDNGFSGCENLLGIIISQDNPDFSSDENGVLFNKEKTSLIVYPAGNKNNEYTIPDSVVYIDAFSFDNCDNLKNITIGKGVKRIYGHAFYDCDNLANIEIPENVSKIEYGAFVSCDNLSGLTILNRNCDLEYFYGDGICDDNTTIYGYSNSTAREHASKCGNTFVAIACNNHNYEPSVVMPPTCTENSGICAVCGEPFVAATGHIDENADKLCDSCGCSVTVFDFTVSQITSDNKIYVTIGCDFDEFSTGDVEVYFDQTYLSYYGYETNIKNLSVFASDYTQEDKVIKFNMFSMESLEGVYDFITLSFDVLQSGSSEILVKAKNWYADTVPSNGHIAISVENMHEYTAIVTPPTCTTEGYTIHTCSECGESYRDNYVEALPHTYIDGSCSCEVCGKYILDYEILDDEVFITGCDKSSISGYFVIPDTIEGCTVTVIGEYAFYSCSNLTSITIPDSVIEIGKYAFSRCYALEYIYGYVGSTAETYANENGITFVAITSNDEPVTDEPTTDKPVTDEPTTDEPVPDEPTTGEPTTDEPTTDEPVTDKPVQDTSTALAPNADSNITVTDTFANLIPEMTVTDIVKSVKNQNITVLSADGKKLTANSPVGTGSKVQVVDRNGKVLSEYDVVVKADVTGDGTITAEDARLALRASASLDKLEGVYATAANYNGDKELTAEDARLILRKSAGLE